ncbi:MAG: hypothetical protein WB930_19785 [Syntrophobacteraceae bacterium]
MASSRIFWYGVFAATHNRLEKGESHGSESSKTMPDYRGHLLGKEMRLVWQGQLRCL